MSEPVDTTFEYPIQSPVWLTRDSDPAGVVCDVIEVWTEKPERHRVTGAAGATWLGAGGSIASRYARLALRSAQALYQTMPDTDRECIVYGD